MAVYLLRHVVHNWSDEDSIKILTRLREAAREDTKLILLEIIMPYACRTSDTTAQQSDALVPGASAGEAPEPLLANFGAVNEFAYLMDMTVSPGFLGGSFAMILSKSVSRCSHSARNPLNVRLTSLPRCSERLDGN